jgi:hypothetical protein
MYFYHCPNTEISQVRTTLKRNSLLHLPYLPVRPTTMVFCPGLLAKDTLRRASGEKSEYPTDISWTCNAPKEGHCRPGSKVRPALSSVGTQSCTLFNRAIAPNEVSRDVQDWTSRKSVVFATMIKLRAKPRSAPVVVLRYRIVNAMRITAKPAMMQSSITFSQHCRQRSK